MDHNKLWQATLAELEISLSQPMFTAWFAQTRVTASEDLGSSLLLTVSCPSGYAKEWIETHYQPQVHSIVQKISGKPTQVQFTITSATTQVRLNQSPSNGPLFEEPSATDLDHVKRKAQLNPHFTFDNFIVGSTNNLAYNASLAVAKAPGKIHNPLFIYGGVGCGKTHLMHAIGNALIAKTPNLHLLYASCEEFTNDLIESLKAKTTEKLRNKYRKLDLLLIDDIQFISKSEYSQEEFFNTFNALYNTGRQIVIASDRLPDEIPKLAARLTSRFQGGVIVDVQPPDLEMRMAILGEKGLEYGVTLPDDVVMYIAEAFRDNTRELEGALKRVVAAAAIKDDVITLDFVRIILGGSKPQLKRRITPRQIVDAVADTFSVSFKDLTGTKRQHQIVVARQVAMYLLRDKLNLQYERIADVLGGKDHTTIMYGVARVENMVENDVEIRGKIDTVVETLSRGIG